MNFEYSRGTKIACGNHYYGPIFGAFPSGGSFWRRIFFCWFSHFSATPQIGISPFNRENMRHNRRITRSISGLLLIFLLFLGGINALRNVLCKLQCLHDLQLFRLACHICHQVEIFSLSSPYFGNEEDAGDSLILSFPCEYQLGKALTEQEIFNPRIEFHFECCSLIANLAGVGILIAICFTFFLWRFQSFRNFNSRVRIRSVPNLLCLTVPVTQCVSRWIKVLVVLCRALRPSRRISLRWQRMSIRRILLLLGVATTIVCPTTISVVCFSMLC